MTETIQPAIIHSTPEAEIVAALGKRLIVLVGMMGAGKSTVGRRLAARLKLPFTDADNEIETAAGMSIPEIFEAHGESHFRDGEARVIARLLESGPGVLATGGGSFMREETRGRIRDKAISMWLKADADVIMRRVRRRADRPLLQTADPTGTVTRLLAERDPVYQDADLMIWSRDVPHDKIVDECVEALHIRLCAPPEAAADPAGDTATQAAATQAMGSLR
jgi:shikimate kinase